MCLQTIHHKILKTYLHNAIRKCRGFVRERKGLVRQQCVGKQFTKKTMKTSLHKAIRKYKVCFRENKAAFRQQCVDKQFMNTCLHDAI